jgi:MFS transporter, MHS family, shikimate and dehydroshikimate transport protein
MQQQAGNRRKIALATLIGSTIEWYDFFIYGIAAALVFNEVFFPQFSAGRGLLLSFATFGVSFVARPFGGLIAGQLGDSIGRKTVLISTLVTMGLSSIGIGLLPGYARIGLAAPILLVFLRFLQGLAVGGEWGGSAVMAVESAPETRRGFWGSFPQMGGPLGLVLANGAMLLTNYWVGVAAFKEWGWRIPFLLSATLLIVGFFIRTRIEDLTEREVVKTGGSIWRPLADIVRTRKRVTISLVFAQAGLNVGFYVFSVAAITYLTTQVGVSRSTALTAIIVGAVVDFCLQPVFGALSDHIGRRTMMAAGNLFLGLMAYVYYQLAGTGEPGMIILATVLGLGIGHAATYGPLASMIAEQYETTSRYTGASVANQLANLLWSAPTPFLAVYLAEGYPATTLPLTLMLIVAVLFSLAGIIALGVDSAPPPGRTETLHPAS